jgi:glycine cleavage system H protein
MLKRLISIRPAIYLSNHINRKIVTYTKKYTKTDEWLYTTKDNTKLGLSQNAIEQMGELVFIEFLADPGDIIKKNEEIIIIESVKAVGTICAPFNCVVIENNIDIEQNLEQIDNNPECIDTSWLIKIDVDN